MSVAVLIVTVLEAITGLIVLYAIKLLVDTISVELAAQNNGISDNILITLAFTALAFLFAALFQILANTLRLRQGLTVSDHVDREIHERAISVGLRYYERPEYYDTLERAREGGSGRPAQLVTNTVITFRATITLIGVFILIGSIEYRLLPALLIPILLALIVRLYFVRKLFDWRMSRAQRERRATYLDLIMTKAMHAKDLRINGIGPFFRDQYSKIRKELRDGEIKIDQARSWSDFAMATIGVVVFIAACTWLLHQSLEQTRPIGDVVLFVMLLRQAERSGNELASNTAKIVNDHLYLQRLFDFLAVPAQAALSDHSRTLPETNSSELTLSNVTFSYDGSNKRALKNISLKIKTGQVVALVGENGSGKTSLIKLLTRLYDPTKGIIRLDGTDIREFDPQEYRKKFSVVFQDYAIYANTVSDNIRFGDVAREESPTAIKTAAQNAGASEFIEELPKGYETPLMKLFDNGQDLSIGQWQRIALARALYPKSEFLILDEPTSAMDPKAEYDLFENFKSRIDGRAALIISHRLSTVRQADFIYVLKAGEIVEQGTHDDLVKAQGDYARLFDKQARFYK
ncbi:MAG: ABC transporter ATP-binding protein [Pseudomonadota bacterium]